MVINMDRDVARLRHMELELARIGLRFERFPALSGADLPSDLRAYFADDASLSPGEVGCYASHLRLCQLMVAGTLSSPALILEDDLSFPDNFTELLAAILGALPDRWDMVRLTNVAKHAVLEVAPLIGGLSLVRYASVPGSTGASLLNRSGAEKFLARAPRNLPIDQDLRRVWRWDLDVYGVHPMPLMRDVFDSSTIDAMAAPGLRNDQHRRRRMRQQRFQETASRIGFALRQFGVRDFARLEFTNAMIAATPKPFRGSLLLKATPRSAGPQ
jgi:glycosyl transferase family 25